mgnify:FL=1
MANEERINEEMLSVQNHPEDIGGYYKFDKKKVTSVMRPSKVFNMIIDNI